jgi:hypothetical protein
VPFGLPSLSQSNNFQAGVVLAKPDLLHYNYNHLMDLYYQQ